MGESTFNVQGAETREVREYKKRKADMGDLDAKSSNIDPVEQLNIRSCGYQYMYYPLHFFSGRALIDIKVNILTIFI